MSATQLENHLLHRLKFRQLRLLIAVDEQRNILRASEQLNIAQPAATKTIRELEDVLGVSLFDRSSRGVAPTLYGEVVINHAKLILSQVRQISEDITSISHGVTGHINIGTLLAASTTLIPQSVLQLKKERPNITVTIIEGTNDKLMPALRTGDIDLVVGRLPEFRERKGISQDVIYDEPIAIVVRKDHPLATNSKLSFAELKGYDWILPPSTTSLRRQIESEFRNARLEPPQQSIESISILTNFKLLTETDMIAAMPMHVVNNNDDLTSLSITFKAATSAIGVSHRTKNTPSKAVSHFIETLKSVAKEMNDA